MTAKDQTKKVGYENNLYALVYKFPEESIHFDPNFPWGVQISKGPFKYVYLNDRPFKYETIESAINAVKMAVSNNVKYNGEIKPSRIIHVQVREYEPYTNPSVKLKIQCLPTVVGLD